MNWPDLETGQMPATQPGSLPQGGCARCPARPEDAPGHLAPGRERKTQPRGSREGAELRHPGRFNAQAGPQAPMELPATQWSPSNDLPEPGCDHPMPAPPQNKNGPGLPPAASHCLEKSRGRAGPPPTPRTRGRCAQREGGAQSGDARRRLDCPADAMPQRCTDGEWLPLPDSETCG